MASTTDSATTRDGVRLLTRHWAVPGGSLPRAAVLFVHGLGEHSGRYEHVGDQLAAAGLETFGWDLRGNGASAGERAWADSWSRFHDDLEDRLAAVRAAMPGLPIVLYGHSMGGLVVLGYLLAGDRLRPDLTVLSAPGVDDLLARWKHLAAPPLARVLPRFHFANGIDAAQRSRDPARQAAVRTDPLMLHHSTAALGAMGFAEQDRVRAAVTSLAARGGSLPVPALVIHGLEDTVVPPSASAVLGTLPGVTRRTYDRIRHELHNEPEGRQILADVIAWIDAELATAGAGPADAAAGGGAGTDAGAAAGV